MTHKVNQWLKQLASSFELPAPEVAQRLRRILDVERNIVLPLKVAAVAMILFSLQHFSSQQTRWFGLPLGSFEITITTVNFLFAAYVVANTLGAGLILSATRLPFALVHWSVFAISLVDGIFFGSLTLMSGGYDSPLFWLFLVLILRSAANTPPLWSQLALNLCLAACFAIASFLAIGLNAQIEEELFASTRSHLQTIEHIVTENTTENIAVRVIVLVLAAVWLFVFQVLLEKQKLAADEALEFSERESQIRSAGRIAAEFAHQIKNPLSIVTNAVFSLERGLKAGKGDPQQHLLIIREEVSRADRIITEVMGYAELTEGRVEKIDLEDKIRTAIAQTLPRSITPLLKVELDLHGPFPPMLMQRRHLTEILANLLQNAREAMNSKGKITMAARIRNDLAVEIVITDNGPGIPKEQLERIFEAYYTTKARGSGIGLAIVKNNVELYGGTVRAESELGKGTRFILVFPARVSRTGKS